MNKIFLCRLFVSAVGILCLLGWTDPVGMGTISSNLDDQEAIIRERIPTAVSIVSPVYNPAVRSYLDIYISRRPEHTAAMLGWAAVYFPMFEKALAEEGLPTDLKYLTIVESALNPAAVSRSGAGGLWQFMKPTARECGLKISSYVDERMDPEKSTKAAVRYLKQLYGMFGNWELVMAAYNAGPGRVRSAIKRAGTDDYWKVSRYLPVETRSYVPGFIAASYLMNFHDAHDIIPVYPEHAMGELTTILIYKGMSIPEVARRSGMTVDEVKQMNPSFVRNYIPTSSYGYAIVLPYASAELFNSNRTMDVPEIDSDGYVETKTVTIGGNIYRITTTSKEHVVRSGDNLTSIASRNNCTVRDLMTWNGLHNSHLAIGQRLEIRYSIRELIPAIVEAPAPVLPARNKLAVNALSALSFGSFTVADRNTTLNLDIVPVINEQPANTFVLQRRQSVRQAINQTFISTGIRTSDCDLPSNGCTGDVVRVR